jgi:hypothetical protein
MSQYPGQPAIYYYYGCACIGNSCDPNTYCGMTSSPDPLTPLGCGGDCLPTFFRPPVPPRKSLPTPWTPGSGTLPVKRSHYFTPDAIRNGLAAPVAVASLGATTFNNGPVVSIDDLAYHWLPTGRRDKPLPVVVFRPYIRPQKNTIDIFMGVEIDGMPKDASPTDLSVYDNPGHGFAYIADRPDEGAKIGERVGILIAHRP